MKVRLKGKIRLTPEQFDLMAELMRFRESGSREAARLLFVEGKNQRQVMSLTGFDQGQVSRIGANCMRWLEISGQFWYLRESERFITKNLRDQVSELTKCMNQLKDMTDNKLTALVDQLKSVADDIRFDFPAYEELPQEADPG